MRNLAAIASIALIAASGCSSSSDAGREATEVGGEAGTGGGPNDSGVGESGDSATPEGAVDGDDCEQSGSLACDEILTAECGRIIQCCAGVAACYDWTHDESACKAHFVASGHNCASAAYANVTVCAAKTTACSEDVPLIACSDFHAGTWNWPASCTAFWAQYP